MEKRLICPRCGYEWVVAKNKRRKGRPLCESCRVRRASTVGKKDDKCVPWHGMFGSDWVTPIDEDGAEVMPGIRTCGHKDCVNPDHIEKEIT